MPHLYRRPSYAALAVTIAAVTLAAGCRNPNASVPGKTEGSVRAQAGTQVGAFQFRELRLKGVDGKPLDGVIVQIAGKNITVSRGVAMIDDATWAEVVKQGKLVLVSGGFMPLTLPLDGFNTEGLTLIKADDQGTPGLVSLSGGTVGAAGDRAMITIPPNFLTTTGTTVLVGTYDPQLGADAQDAFKAEVSNLLVQRGKGGDPCAAPFICKPITGGLGVSVTIDGPVAAGKIDVTIDLATLLRGWNTISTPPWTTAPADWTPAQIADAESAARIIEAFRAFDASGDPSYREAMEKTYGITLAGTLLTFPVKLGDTGAVDGLTRVEVEGLSVLGTRLEVTFVSTAKGSLGGSLARPVAIDAGAVPERMIDAKLPDFERAPGVKTAVGSFTPDNGPDAIFGAITAKTKTPLIRDDDSPVTLTAAELLTNNGGALISNNTGSLTLKPGVGLISDANSGLVSNNAGSFLANNAAGLISSNGGSVITNNGGTLVSNNSGGLISNNSGGLVSNNSGGLISNNGGMLGGYAYFPFAPVGAKYQLLQFGPPAAVEQVRETATGLLEYLWPGMARVRAIMANGTPLTDWSNVDGSGGFSVVLPETVPIVFFLQSEITVPDKDGKPRRAYSMAFAPGKKKISYVAMDASTTMVATSTLHLLEYIPPEQLRLNGLLASFEDVAADLAEELPPGADLNDLASGGKRDNKKPYVLLQEVSPEDQAAAQQLLAYYAQMGAIEARLGELGVAWGAFNPFNYGKDLGESDGIVTQKSAVEVSKAENLRKAYDPMYEFSRQGHLAPESYDAINPDSPPITAPAE